MMHCSRRSGYGLEKKEVKAWRHGRQKPDRHTAGHTSVVLLCTTHYDTIDVPVLLFGEIDLNDSAFRALFS